MTKSGNKWTETLIYSFEARTGCGRTSPQAGVIFDRHGNLFGTTASRRNYGYGTVFELTYLTDGTGQRPSSTTFKIRTTVRLPTAGLVLDGSGNLIWRHHLRRQRRRRNRVRAIADLGTPGLSHCSTAFPDSKAGMRPVRRLSLWTDSGNLYGTRIETAPTAREVSLS